MNNLPPSVVQQNQGDAASKRRIRIAFMFAPVSFGGAERVCMMLLKSINRQEFDVVPILLTQPWESQNPVLNELRLQGFNCHEIPVAIQPTGDYFRIARCWKLLSKLFEEVSFDLLHTHGYYADMVGIPVARIKNIPSLSTCHGFIANNRRWRTYNAINRIVLRFASGIVAVSADIKRDLVQSGIRHSKISVLANAVDIGENSGSSNARRLSNRALNGFQQDEFVVGFVGRLSAEKGLVNFLKACEILVRNGINLRPLIVGDGPQRMELEDLSRQLHLDKRVLFTGFQEDILQWHACMDVFVLPSLTEGTPMALLEAMASSLPVVASAVGGIPQVVTHGKTGLLFPAGNADEIANSILSIFRDSEMGRHLATNALVHMQETYGIDRWIRRVEAEYQRLSTGDA